MNFDEDKFYIKIVALDVIYNFVVGKSLIWNWLESQNIVLTPWISKVKI